MKKLKKLLVTFVLATFLFGMPVFSEGREALENEETQLPVSAQTGSPSLLQSITIGIGRRRRRRARRRAWWRRRARIRRNRRRGRHLGWRIGVGVGRRRNRGHSH